MTTQKMGQKEGEGLSGPQGRSWARESEEGHCSAVEVVSSIRIFTAAGLPVGKESQVSQNSKPQETTQSQGNSLVRAPPAQYMRLRAEQSYKFQNGSAEKELARRKGSTCCGVGSGARFARRLRMLRSDICSLTATGGIRAIVAGSRVTSAFMSLSSSSSCFRTAQRGKEKQ